MAGHKFRVNKTRRISPGLPCSNNKNLSHAILTVVCHNHFSLLPLPALPPLVAAPGGFWLLLLVPPPPQNCQLASAADDIVANFSQGNYAGSFPPTRGLIDTLPGEDWVRAKAHW